MDLKNKPTPLERLMKKKFEEMSPQELKRIRTVSSVFFATAFIILGMLLDYLSKTNIKFSKYIFMWLVCFLGMYILVPIASRGKIGKPTKKIKTFFIIIGIGAILMALLRIIFLLVLYIQNRPFIVEGKIYSVTLWPIIFNFIILLLLTIGIAYVWKSVGKFK